MNAENDEDERTAARRSVLIFEPDSHRALVTTARTMAPTIGEELCWRRRTAKKRKPR